MCKPIPSIFAAIPLFAMALFAGGPANGQAEATVKCKDGSSYTVSVPGGSCKAEPGEYATCIGATEGTEAKAVCGGGCTSDGDGKCSAQTVSTPPPGPKVKVETAAKPSGIKTTGAAGQQKGRTGAVATPPAGIKGAAGAGSAATAASKASTSDINFTKQADKSSPSLMKAPNLDEARTHCGRNPKCRVVRDDAEITAFCAGNNCVAAKKKGKGKVEYLQVTMSDVLVTSAARVRGKPLTTSQGIIAILIGLAPTMSKATEPGKLETPNLKAGRLKGESVDTKHKDALRAPPPANLLESGPTPSPSASGPARAGSIRRDTVAPSLGGPGGPAMGTR